MTTMEPIPATIHAIKRLDPIDEDDLLGELGRLADRAQEIVPDLVGVSVAQLDQGLTFTLVATAEAIAVLDAIQYLSGGPCVQGAHTNQVLEFDNDDALDEKRWHLFAQATAARAVRSTLTLPVVSGGRVDGTVNLYAASRRAFVGHHDTLAEVFGAWAAGAMANADLSFTTRDEAQATPGRVQEQFVIQVAAGITAAQLGEDLEAANARMQDAASRAEVSMLQLAREIVRAHEGTAPDED